MPPITAGPEYWQDRSCYRPADLRGLLARRDQFRQAIVEGSRQGVEGRVLGGVPAHSLREERIAIVADVERALRQLECRAPRFARAVVLAIVQGLPDEEIAGAVGVRVGLVPELIEEGLVAMAASLGYVGEE